jgi:hypothetical protein
MTFVQVLGTAPIREADIRYAESVCVHCIHDCIHIYNPEKTLCVIKK